MAKVYLLDPNAQPKYKKRAKRIKKYSKYVLFLSLLLNVGFVIYFLTNINIK